MEIDLPEVVAEVRAAFDRYEKALVSNDVATLDALFHDDARTIRYGGGENLYGYAEIKVVSRRALAGRPGAHLVEDRHQHLRPRLRRRVDAVSSRQPCPAKSAARCRPGCAFHEGWRVVAAHVSVIDEQR